MMMIYLEVFALDDEVTILEPADLRLWPAGDLAVEQDVVLLVADVTLGLPCDDGGLGNAELEAAVEAAHDKFTDL